MMEPEVIVTNMMGQDAFSTLLGMKVEQITPGNSVVTLKILPSMVNGFQIAHGAITYALADSAMAFASNAFGKKSFSIDTSISHLRKVRLHDCLTAYCRLLHSGTRTGAYEVEIRNQENKRVAHFKGTVCVTDEAWGER